MTAAATKQYLEIYAEEEARLVARHLATHHEAWERVVCLPLYNETHLFPDALKSLVDCCGDLPGRSLAIIVLNAKDSDSPEVWQESLESGVRLKTFGESWKTLTQSPPIRFSRNAFLDYIVVDRAADGFRFPADQGVGLARKIGCDIACALHAAGKIAQDWIFTSDADVLFPKNYFSLEKQNASAAVCQYEHIPVDAAAPSWHSLQLYEISLRYYEKGLRHAGSPYAFQTLGSTIAVRPSFYAQVRGFPKRLAGEDFYILNKLAKIAPIFTHSAANLQIKDRDSARVPFGTGTSVTKIQNKLAQNENFTLYAPQAFSLLRVWLETAKHYLESGDVEALTQTMREATQKIEAPATLWDGLNGELKLLTGIQAVFGKSPDIAMRLRHFDTWFDALKTLRFVHECRNQAFPSYDYRQVLADAEFLDLGLLPKAENVFQTLQSLRV